MPDPPALELAKSEPGDPPSRPRSVGVPIVRATRCALAGAASYVLLEVLNLGYAVLLGALSDKPPPLSAWIALVGGMAVFGVVLGAIYAWAYKFLPGPSHLVRGLLYMGLVSFALLLTSWPPSTEAVVATALLWLPTGLSFGGLLVVLHRGNSASGIGLDQAA